MGQLKRHNIFSFVVSIGHNDFKHSITSVVSLDIVWVLKVTCGTTLDLDFDNQSESEEPPMTEETMNLRALFSLRPDADLLRKMIGFANQLQM